MIVCVARQGGDILTGAGTGVLHRWAGGLSIKESPKIHTACIDALLVTPTHVFTGGRDSKISVLDGKTLSVVFQIDCNQFAGSVCNFPRAIALDNKSLFVGTFGSEIWKMSLEMVKKTVGKPEVKIQGHYAPMRTDNNEAWGLSIFRDKE